MKDFRDFGLKDQVCRASISVSNNIAEEFDRQSTEEFRRFLFFAPGSCSEVKSMIYLAEKLGYLDSVHGEELRSRCSEIARIYSRVNLFSKGEEIFEIMVN